MISVKEAEEIHKILIDNFGGSHGLRDLGSLESALARPFQSFENQELYPTVILKAAALLESILINHPFIDGNKRVGYTLLRLFLLSNGLDIEASQGDKYEFIINVTTGKKDFDGITEMVDITYIQKHRLIEQTASPLVSDEVRVTPLYPPSLRSAGQTQH